MAKARQMKRRKQNDPSFTAMHMIQLKVQHVLHNKA